MNLDWSLAIMGVRAGSLTMPRFGKTDPLGASLNRAGFEVKAAEVRRQRRCRSRRPWPLLAGEANALRLDATWSATTSARWGGSRTRQRCDGGEPLHRSAPHLLGWLVVPTVAA